MISFEKHIYELETLGFTIVPNIFSSELVIRLKEKLKIALEEDNKMFSDKAGKNPDLIVDLTIHNHDFLKALDNDVIQEIFSRMLGNDAILYSYTSTILKPDTVGGVRDIHIDTNKFIPNYVTGIVMTMALDDFTEENGATLYLPGSHVLNAAPEEEIFSKNSLSTARKAGDALFFNPRVFHRAGINKTNNIRYGITAYATRAFIKQRFDFPRMVPKETLKVLSERMIRFLGFHSRVPDSLEQYYLPPEKRNRRE